jgi:hypothetical protein
MAAAHGKGMPKTHQDAALVVLALVVLALVLALVLA